MGVIYPHLKYFIIFECIIVYHFYRIWKVAQQLGRLMVKKICSLVPTIFNYIILKFTNMAGWVRMISAREIRSRAREPGIPETTIRRDWAAYNRVVVDEHRLKSR